MIIVINSRNSISNKGLTRIPFELEPLSSRILLSTAFVLWNRHIQWAAGLITALHNSDCPRGKSLPRFACLKVSLAWLPPWSPYIISSLPFLPQEWFPVKISRKFIAETRCWGSDPHGFYCWHRLLCNAVCCWFGWRVKEMGTRRRSNPDVAVPLRVGGKGYSHKQEASLSVPFWSSWLFLPSTLLPIFSLCCVCFLTEIFTCQTQSLSLHSFVKCQMSCRPSVCLDCWLEEV